jgi:hypothetical protein
MENTQPNGGTTGIYLNLGATMSDYYHIDSQGGANYNAIDDHHQGIATFSALGARPSGLVPMVFVNGALSTSVYREDQTYTGPALPLVTNSGGQVGSGAGAANYFWGGNVYEVVIWNTALTPSQVQQVFAYARATYGTSLFGVKRAANVINVGDSITAGAASTLENNRQNQEFSYFQGGQFSYALRNYGLSGSYLYRTASDITAMTNAYDAGYPMNIALLGWGFNDLVYAGRTAVEVYTDMGTWASKVKAAQPGYKILVSTITPSADCSTEAARTTLNNMLRTSLPPNVDGLVDYTKDSVMNACPGNPAYYQDIHPNSAGYARLAPIAYDTLKIFIAGIAPTNSPVFTGTAVFNNVQINGTCTGCSTSSTGSSLSVSGPYLTDGVNYWIQGTGQLATPFNNAGFSFVSGSGETFTSSGGVGTISSAAGTDRNDHFQTSISGKTTVTATFQLLGNSDGGSNINTVGIDLGGGPYIEECGISVGGTSGFGTFAQHLNSSYEYVDYAGGWSNWAFSNPFTLKLAYSPGASKCYLSVDGGKNYALIANLNYLGVSPNIAAIRFSGSTKDSAVNILSWSVQ